MNTVAPRTSSQRPTHAIELAVFNFLQWYTSWFYWAAGIYLGFATGAFYGVRVYIATLLYDLFHFFGRRPPPAVKEATVAPDAGTVLGAAKATTRTTAKQVESTAKTAARTVESKVPTTTTPAPPPKAMPAGYVPPSGTS